uniref:Uncharacterized protein n=1 Tax=Heterorhabditis bacteriophora TaxID=37862 RepID=A0A1I7WM68_HETBA
MNFIDKKSVPPATRSQSLGLQGSQEYKYLPFFRMHLLYTIIRLVSMLTDIYVCYHAKGLNILEEEQDEVIKDVRKGSIRLNSLPAATQ